MPIHISHKISENLRAVENNINVARSNIQRLTQSNGIDSRIGNELQGLITTVDQLREAVSRLVHDLRRIP